MEREIVGQGSRLGSERDGMSGELSRQGFLSGIKVGGKGDRRIEV